METRISEGFKESLAELEGVDVEALIASLDEASSVAIRFNKRKIASVEDCAGLYPEMERVGWCEEGYYLSSRPIFTLNPLLHAGLFYVQDASSMLYQQIMERLVERIGKMSPRVLDFCAAPGGKTTAIINALPDAASLVANEFMPARGKILRENLEKWGYPNVITTGASSSEYSSLRDEFDIVAVDAPCSGEGMMRKDEEARRQWSPALVAQCAALQRKILGDIVETVKPGGFLIYSTCTFNLHEDEDNAVYLSEELGMIPIPVDDLNLDGIEGIARALKGVEGLRFMPHISKGEGLFVAVFQKPLLSNSPDGVSDSIKLYRPESGKILKSKKTKGKKNGAESGKSQKLSNEDKARLREWMSGDMDFELSGDMVTALPRHMSAQKERIVNAGIRITGAGLPAAIVKSRDLIPDSRLVVSTAFNRDAFPEIELNEEDALRYLRRESFPLSENVPTGYIVVTYRNIPLGMMKNLGPRANNLYPQSWKIRFV